MDPFEQRLKDALKDFEVPYNSADWSQLERNLNDGSTRGRWSSVGLYGLLIASAVGVTTLFLLWDREQHGGEAKPAGNIALVEPASETLNADETLARTVGVPAGEDAPATTTREVALEQPTATRTVPVEMSASRSTSIPNSTSIPKPPDPSATEPAPSKESPKANSNELGFKASISEGCPGTSIQFAAENVPENGIYLWNFGDGSFSNRSAPSHTFNKAGKYEVMLSVSNTAGGNIRNKPASDLIVIHEAPQASFSALKQEYEGHIPSVHFENRSQGGAAFHWDFGDGNQSTVAHPDHIFKRKGTYQVVLTVTNERGCVDKREREVRIDRDYNLDAPSSFSPNGDGSDDLFMPEALRSLQPRFVMTIHEARTGRKVYETRDATKPWNGRLDNRGEPCPTGEYVWMVEIKEGAHLGDVNFDGKVSLVR